MEKFKKIFSWSILVFSLFLIIIVIFSPPVAEGIKASKNDVSLYKIFLIIVFSSFFLVSLASLVLPRFYFFKEVKPIKKFLLYFTIVFVGFCVGGIFYSMTSKEFQKQISAPRSYSHKFESSNEKKLPQQQNKKKTAKDTKEAKKATKDTKETKKATKDTKETKKTTNDSKEISKSTKPVKNKSETNTPSKTPTSVMPDSIYSKLSAEQFKLLTNILSHSFYSFSLSKDTLETIKNSPEVLTCLETLFDYAYDNNFLLDPEYVTAFAMQDKSIETIKNWGLLQNNFIVDHTYNLKTGNWQYSINSYTLDPKDVVTYEDRHYIDAEGYLNKGVVLYWIEDKKMVKVGEVSDIAYNKEIDGHYIPYAVNIKFYDDPYSSGWQNGEIILTTNKKFSGNPIYYVDVLDPNRNLSKEYIDYSGKITWTPLTSKNAKRGVAVYHGITSAKSYIFEIVSIDAKKDIMMVKYPSGSVEQKSYSSMLSSKKLYIK